MEYKDYKINKTKSSFVRIINSALMFILVFSIVFFPSDSLNSKIVSFGLLLTLNASLLAKKLLKKENILILFFGIVFPALLIILSTVINNFDISSAISNAYIMTYILLVIIINHYDIKYEKIFIFSLSCLSILITISGILDLVGIYSLGNNTILEFFRMRNEARVGYWPTTTFGYVIFFKASPLLIVLVGYSLKKKKLMMLLITVVAMGFTGTRANLYASILLVFVYYVFYKRTTIIKVLTSIIFATGVIFILPKMYLFVKNASELKTSTDLIKYKHFTSIVNFLFENPLYFITGSGLGSFFFTTGLMEYTNLTELAFLDLFRQIGLIGFIPFLLFLFRPVRVLFKVSNYQWLGLSYIGYLIIAFTNPLLFSSTPFALYVYIYMVFYKENNLIKQKKDDKYEKNTLYNAH